jgi:rfaE bifunctional protein kinase chain/domain/rfaE bifunctional protein nucleotidyltransferase chain/domain
MKSFFEKYKYKIKTLDQILSLRKLEKKKFVMCHGNFDVVHLGHIRHLTYAKDFGEVLLVSITADSKIVKGATRPHVPQELRALNLAALEIVDFVIIDYHSTPISNLTKIKPEFYVKGFEYERGLISTKTFEEKNTVEKYGGKMHFSPGDLVLSSTHLINKNKPNIDIEKLALALNAYSIDLETIKKKLLDSKKIKIHVVGDTIIDKYTNTNFIGYNAKTPTPSVSYFNENKYLGGAGVVSLHFKFGGAETIFTTVTGNDRNKDFVKKILEKHKVKLNLIEDDLRPTTEKNLIIADNYRMLKIDKVVNSPISVEISEFIKNKITNLKADAVVFSDFKHGLFNKNNIKDFCKCIPKKSLKVADSQVASRWGNIADFINFDLITPNEKECRFAVGDQDANLSEISRLLYKKSQFKNLILKLGSKGIFAVSKKLNKTAGALALPSFVETLVDPVGAGDSLLAYSVIAYLRTKCFVSSIIIGNLAAAIECENEGNRPVELKEVIKRLDLLSKKIKQIL